MAVTVAEQNRRKRQRKKYLAQMRRCNKEEEEKQRSNKLSHMHSNNDADKYHVIYTTKPLVIKDSFGCSNNTINIHPFDDNEVNFNNKDTIASIIQRFQHRASILVTNNDKSVLIEKKRLRKDHWEANEGDKELCAYNSNICETYYNSCDAKYNNEDTSSISKRQKREMKRPMVAELKNRVKRADLVEAHDVTAQDPEFLLFLKGIPGTVPVPRHWGRKRKYLQGKRGIEKSPFRLPEFIVKTGIMDVRAAVMEDESKMSMKQKNRNRVAPKMGSLDLDYRVLHDAFFKYQNRESVRAKATKLGDLYYEGKEYETRKSASHAVGGPLSERLRDALGMVSSLNSSPPPWLINMQRYGPPPSYPNLRISGLNAPLPEGCSYGYHLNGWGKPPVDVFGRPLYGGNPFDPAGSDDSLEENKIEWEVDGKTGSVITSDGKTIGRKPWGGLEIGNNGDMELENMKNVEEESDEGLSSTGKEDEIKSDGEISQVDDQEEVNLSYNDASKELKYKNDNIISSEDGVSSVIPASVMDLRKQTGDQTPAPLCSSHETPVQKQLYTVLKETWADKGDQNSAVFSSDTAYVISSSGVGTGHFNSGDVTSRTHNGGESVLSKVIMNENKFSSVNVSTKQDEDEYDVNLEKKFKF